MNKKTYGKVCLVILVVFSISLVFYFLFAASSRDGLEQTMASAGITEQESVYHAPLDYGSNYQMMLGMGCLGFCITLLIVYITGKLLRNNKQ
jgi:cobalt/nickel transport protein